MVKTKSATSKQESKRSQSEQEDKSLLENSVTIGTVDLADIVMPLLKLTHLEDLFVVITHDREKAIRLKTLIKNSEESKELNVLILLKGTSPISEVKKLLKKYQVIISTETKLSHHLLNTKNFGFSNLKFMVIENFDKALESSQSDIETIIGRLQTTTCSKFLLHTKHNKSLDYLSSHFDALIVRDKSINSELRQVEKYVEIDADQKFLVLHTFVFKNQGKKLLVLFSHTSEVKFFRKIFKVLGIHAKSSHSLRSKEKNASIHSDFITQPSGLLLSTPESISDISRITLDFLIIYDFPDVSWYKAFAVRSISETCKIIFFLVTGEKKLWKKELKTMSNLNITRNQILNVQAKIEKTVEKNYEIYKASREAYRNYILSTSLRDYQNIAKSFGLARAPLVNGIED